MSAPLLRPITGFHQDDQHDWVAELTCGHGQHVRHRPPFWSRPWVITAEGRAEKIGVELPCVLCARFELPRGFVSYKRTPEFTADSMPAGLAANHSTKRGVWGLLHVVHGRVRYVVEPPLAREVIVGPGEPAVIVPEVPHRVELDGDTRFFVEFLRRDPLSP